MKVRFSHLGASLAVAVAAAALVLGLVRAPSAVGDDRVQFFGTTLSGAPFNGASLQGKPAGHPRSDGRWLTQLGRRSASSGFQWATPHTGRGDLMWWHSHRG
jgi:hypothetical protein